MRRNHQRLPACRMSREVKEDVDLIRMNTCRRLLRTALGEICVTIHHAGDPICRLTLERSYVVETNLISTAVIGRKKLYRKVQNNMVGQIR